MLKARRHDGILLHTAVPLKKDDFNTPYGILFSEKENDGFDRYSKPSFSIWISCYAYGLLPL